MHGININDSTQPFTAQILMGCKVIETRKSPSLRPYLGKEIGLVQTGRGKAHCVGTVIVKREIKYKDQEEFLRDESKHLVNRSNKYFPAVFPAFGYELTDVKPHEPFRVFSYGIISRNLDQSDIDFARKACILTP